MTKIIISDKDNYGNDKDNDGDDNEDKETRANSNILFFSLQFSLPAV